MMTLRIDFKDMPSAMSPPRQHVGAAGVLELVGKFEQPAQQGGAVVVGEIDQAGLGDEPAKLDQVVSTLAALHDPGSRIEARGDGFSPSRQRQGLGQRPQRR